MKLFFGILTALFFTSTSSYHAFAAGAYTALDAQSSITSLGGLISVFTSSVVKATGTLFMSLAVVAFIFGIVEYIWGMREAKEDRITKGRQFMIWSLVGLFVMFSVYGIIKIVQDTIFQGKVDPTKITIPEINLQSGGNNTNSGQPSQRVDNLGGGINTNPVNLGGSSVPTADGGAGYDYCSGRSYSSCEVSGCVWSYSSNSCVSQ